MGKVSAAARSQEWSCKKAGAGSHGEATMANDLPAKAYAEPAAGDPSGAADDSSRPREGYGFFCQVADERHFERIRSRIDNKGYYTDRVLFERVSVRQSDIVLLV